MSTFHTCKVRYKRHYSKLRNVNNSAKTNKVKKHEDADLLLNFHYQKL